jgi:hypothetical protein
VTVYAITASFVRGEISPKLRGRVDIEQYGQGLAVATNWLVTPQGGVDRRPGTKFVAPLRDETEKGRLIEFEFDEEQAYCLIFNDATIRIATLGAMVGQTAQSITGITKADPAVVTYSGSDTFANGDRVLISGVVGMTEINNRVVTVANASTGSNTFECSGLDSTDFTTYASGGTVQELVEVSASDYVEGVLYDLQIAQAADTVYIANGTLPPAKLMRSSDTSWTLTTAIAFEDGPWLPEDTQGTTLTPAATGSAVAAKMTSNSTSSYTAADDDSSANAYKVFDQDLGSSLALTGTSGWVSIDFPSTDTKVADAYWLAAPSTFPELMPTHWVVEGYTGSAWVVVDGRAGETAWAAGERRYFEMPNATAYQAYRLTWYAVDGGDSTEIAEWVLHESGSTQSWVNLTASSTTGINGGDGFQSSDVGRTIRLMGSDGVWRWARIRGFTSTTVVTIQTYFHALLDLTPITRWQLSAWSETDGYPVAVGFYQDRLTWGGSLSQPRTIWASESANYESHHLSDPLQENDAIAAEMTGNQVSAVAWIEEMGELIAGTRGAIRVLGPAAQAEPFSSYNVQSRQASALGASSVQPLVTDTGLLYVDRYRKRLVAFRPAEGGGYSIDDISWWSDHLLAGQVVDIAFQEDRFNVAWLVTETGDLVACTYLPEYGVVGFTPVVIGGTDVAVESVAAIPSAGGAAVYLIVKRTINGETRRYVEVMAKRHETGDDVEDAVFLDSAATVTGSDLTTVTGLTWLIGETVGVFADGVDIGDAEVDSSGSITLPDSATADKVTVGLRYTSRLETLRAPSAGNRDGSTMGRQMQVKSVALDLLNAKGLKAGSLLSRDPFPHPDREASGLNTGVFPNVPTEDSGTNGGVVVVHTDRAYPATIRALIAALDGAP